MPNYKHLFFDLDHTLWDFDTNSRETLVELFHELELERLGVPAIDIFIENYYECNSRCWALYRNGKISREVLRAIRFREVLQQFNVINEDLVETMADEYLSRAPHKLNLMPHTVRVLEKLQQNHTLHLITNGFRETQYIKLDKCDLGKYFTSVVTSEEAGSLKPDSKIFHYSLEMAGAVAENSIYIGDHLETDIIGARNAGLDQVYFNPLKKVHKENPTFEVHCLSELPQIFNGL